MHTTPRKRQRKKCPATATGDDRRTPWAEALSPRRHPGRKRWPRWNTGGRICGLKGTGPRKSVPTRSPQATPWVTRLANSNRGITSATPAKSHHCHHDVGRPKTLLEKPGFQKRHENGKRGKRQQPHRHGGNLDGLEKRGPVDRQNHSHQKPCTRSRDGFFSRMVWRLARSAPGQKDAGESHASQHDQRRRQGHQLSEQA